MTFANLQKIIQEIVQKATELKNKHTDEIDTQVNYACILSHSEAELPIQEFKAPF